MTVPRPITVSASLVLISLAGLLVVASVSIVRIELVVEQLPDRLTAAAVAEIDRQADATRAAALVAIADLRRDTMAQIRDTRADLMRRVDASSAALEEQLALTREQTLALVDRRSAEVLRQLAPVAGNTADLIAAAQPTVQYANQLGPPLMRQLLGLTAAGKVTLGETAQTMRTINQNAPATVGAVREIAQSGRDMASSGASIARSWEKQTPLYVRFLGWGGSLVMRLKGVIDWIR